MKRLIAPVAACTVAAALAVPALAATKTVRIVDNAFAPKSLTVAKGTANAELEALALASEKVQRALDGAEVRKVIVVPDRLVNLVA